MLEIQRTNHTGQVTWCWERWKAGGEGDDRGGDGWMASPTPWTGAWESSGIWRRKGKHAVLHGVTKCRTQLSDGTTEQQPQSHMKAFPPQVATRAQVKDRCAQHLSESLGSSSPASRIISPHGLFLLCLQLSHPLLCLPLFPTGPSAGDLPCWSGSAIKQQCGLPWRSSG